MKEPRDILLARHRHAEPALDRIRTELCRTLDDRQTRGAPDPTTRRENALQTLWQELFVTCRRYWMTLGTAWCAMILLSALGGGGVEDGRTPVPTPSQPALQALLERQRLRAELMGLATVEDARTARRESPTGPRSEAGDRHVNV